MCVFTIWAVRRFDTRPFIYVYFLVSGLTLWKISSLSTNSSRFGIEPRLQVSTCLGRALFCISSWDQFCLRYFLSHFPIDFLRDRRPHFLSAPQMNEEWNTFCLISYQCTVDKETRFCGQSLIFILKKVY